MTLAIGTLISAGVVYTKLHSTQETPDDLLIRTINYTTNGGQPLSLCLVETKGAKPGPRAVVAFIGWGGTDDGVRLLGRFARSGYLGVSLGYRRLTPETLWVEQIKDCKCAIRFLRAHATEYWLDAERIGVWGVLCGRPPVSGLGHFRRGERT